MAFGLIYNENENENGNSTAENGWDLSTRVECQMALCLLWLMKSTFQHIFIAPQTKIKSIAYSHPENRRHFEHTVFLVYATDTIIKLHLAAVNTMNTFFV